MTTAEQVVAQHTVEAGPSRPEEPPARGAKKKDRRRPRLRTWIASLVLLLLVGGAAIGLAAWKDASMGAIEAAAARQPEPMETVSVAIAAEREYRRTTVAIGTVLALRSITLRNEMPGTVQRVALESGQVVEAGTVLVALDVSVEEAELKAQQAQVALTRTVLQRLERAGRAASAIDVDRARAEHDIALAQVARTRAIIARKTILAPFRARVGLADLHVGQFLNEGTELTTLQGIDDAVHVDFSVTQEVVAGLEIGEFVEVATVDAASPARARIVAIDARVDRATRNAMVRAELGSAAGSPTPGASVRVRVPIGLPARVPAIPADALRKGPDGNHVFVVEADEHGVHRAHLRRVESGGSVAGQAIIRNGLEVGERVAATGSFKLREGSLVAVVNAAALAPASAPALDPGK